MQRQPAPRSARTALSTLVLASALASTGWVGGCVVYFDGSLDVGADDVGETGESSDTATGDEDSSSGETTLGGETTFGDETTDGPTDGCAQAIDIVFVVDNSGSMGGRQRRVAEAIGSLVNQLDARAMDWRIGVTTTDNGNPWCPAGTTTPEGGKLVASSCRGRLNDFLFGDSVDVQDEACRDVCNVEEIELASTVIDGVSRPGVWVERSAGLSNTFERVGQDLVPLDPIAALRCMLPQGVNGCGFESQLESMYLSLTRTADPNEASFGFLRPEAQLAVVIVSDEADCSYNKDWSEIFDQDGNRAFWSDPNANVPTSALCWNAGVTCVGEGPDYANCSSANKDVEGNLIVDAGLAQTDAVLFPVPRYTDLLNQLEQAKHAFDPDATVKVFGIVGLGTDGELHYADGMDPSFQDSFGIGAGCSGEGEGEGEGAVPPVRMRDVAANFDGSLHSVCKPQYIDAFKTIANRVSAGCGQ